MAGRYGYTSATGDRNQEKTFVNRLNFLKDEQERVQKKTFTNWMNTYLCQKKPPIKVDNLFEQVKDGTVLLSLLEVLSGEKLPMEKGPRLRRPHHLANISTALNFLEKKKIKLVNINATSIADGKPAIVLGLVWTIILYFQIEETINAVPDGDASKKKSALPKQNLLAWAESVLTKKYGLNVKDFGKSWKDGVAFNAMIHNIRPDLVDMEQIRRQQARISLEHAFSTAETHLGIPRLLDPEDVDVEKPDEKSIMTYVAQFLKAYPDAGAGLVPSANLDTADKEMKAYNSLMTWLNNEAKEILDSSQEPAEDRESEFLDYIGFKTELDRREPVYLKIGEKVLTGQAAKITQGEWEKLDLRWQEVAEQVYLWLLKLDCMLPGKLGKLGQWLYDAEKLMRKKEELSPNHEEMAKMFAQLSKEHREFFKDLEEWKNFFAQVKRAGRYEGMALQGPQIEHMSKRLENVTLHATVRQNRLDYSHAKHNLLALLVTAETKLGQWTDKYGKQDSVEDLLSDFVDYVERRKMADIFEQTLSDLKTAADVYKKGGADNIESAQIDQFIEGVATRWKKVTTEVKTVRSMLEEVIKTWTRYSACVDIMTVWLNDGEQAMRLSLEEKEEFFKDLAQYEEKHKILNESANFLVDVVTEPVGEEIKQTVLLLNRRFTDLVEGFQSFRQNEVVGKARENYQAGVGRLETWLGESSDILARPVRCVHAELKAYLLELDDYNNKIQEIENDFKVTTKTAQSLVKDSSQDVVNDMLQTLNVQKEAIVKLRKDIPERIKYLKAVLPNIESLETGILDLDNWLDRGQQLLDSHRPDPTLEDTESRLEKHKAFFSEITYQKSILESKNKVFQKIGNTKAKLTNIDFQPADELMALANEKFKNVVTSAKDCEKKLEQLVRLWRSLQQKQQVLEEWLDSAQNILDDQDDDADSLIRKHKMFFDRVEKKKFSDYENGAKEILQQLDVSDRGRLEQTVNGFRERWEHVNHHAPMKLLKLEFAVPEDKFEQAIEKAEAALQQQQEQIKRNDNVKEALAKHRQMFQDGSLVSACEGYLENMKKTSQQLLKLSREEKSLDQRYRDHHERFKKLRMIADDTHLQLKQLPERWKEYHHKMGDVEGWVQNVEKLIEDMTQQNLTGDEYKELLAKFQRELRNMNKYQEDSRWLEKSLEELIKDAPESDASRERERLRGVLARLQGLKPHMDRTADKSGIMGKSYEYRDNVGRKSSWLDEAQRLAMEHPSIDSLEDARAYLHEHEFLISKLESERANIQADIEAGRRLERDKNAPEFIQQTVADLDRKWKDTNQLAKAKHEKLKKQVKDWESYEGEKSTLLTYLKKAEAELEKPTETLNQETAQKDFNSKKELQNTLNKLKGSLSEMSKLNSLLAEGASRERQGPLKGEMTDIDKRLDSVSHRLNAKLTDLEATIAKWSEYYKRLNNFCDWLNEKEAKLNEIYEDKRDSPEEQLKKAEGISSQVYENHVTLENLEKDARGLSQNFRSRETSALKSKLTSVRRQWESLCARAKDRSSALSGNVAHWQKYQQLHEQLMPWIMKAEKYCGTELPKCSSLEEAKELYDLHQSFLQECEEYLPVFDQMSTEAGYLMERPNMHRDLEAIQKRWGNILSNSEERSQKMDKMHGAWTAYANELDNFQETLDKIHGRLDTEPNVNTTDVQSLEHQLALSKALQEEVRSHQPQLNALQRQFEQVQAYSSPDGLRVLKSKQDSVKANWNDINAAAADRQKVLAAALQHRKDFYGRLQDTESWLKKLQRKLDTGNEIYADEVGDTKAKLKSMRLECENQEPMFQAIQQEFKDLISQCSEEEAAALTERYDRLMQGYSNMEDLISHREDLCNKWTTFSDAKRDAQTKIKSLQARLASPDIKEEEVAQCMREIDALKQTLKPWETDSEKLDELMADAQMVIKDRATQRTLHFGSELATLENQCDVISTSARQKEEQLGELTQLSAEFQGKKDGLVQGLIGVQERIMAAKAGKSDLQGIKDLVREIEDIRDDLYQHNPEYEQLRELGRQIMQTDPAKAAALQAQLGQVNGAWEEVQAMLADKQQQYSSLANMWQQYNDAKLGVMRIVDDVDPLVSQTLTFSNQADVKKSLDKHKNAEFELHANQTQLDHMNNKGLQLLEELKNLRDFDLTAMESDLDDVNLKWETANAVVEQHKENLEAQLVCWDQVKSGEEEVSTWLTAMVNKLDDGLNNFEDAVSIESRLIKFKEEAPYFEDVMAEVSQKLADLKGLNQDQSVPELTSAQKDIQLKFEKAVALANQLDSMMSNFSEEQHDLQSAMTEQTDWMNELKEALTKCDDVTGTKEDLIERLIAAKKLEEELSSHQREITGIQDKTSSLQEKFPSSETASLAKDALVVTKKYESLMQRADRIQDSLLGQLESQCDEAQQHQLRWLNAAKEKAGWCGDMAGDRYSVEAKLATVKDLQASLQEGEKKREDAKRRLDAIRDVLPKAKLAELEAHEKAMEKEWQTLVKQLTQTEGKLESCMDQWKDYDSHYDNISHWLKNTEAKLRTESVLQPDLMSKKEQLDFFKSLDQEVQSNRREVERMRDSAQQISHSSGDNRTASYAGQLVSRFQTLAASVKEQIDKSQQNITDHENYTHKHKAVLDWMNEATQELEQCASLSGDEDALNTKLAIVKELNSRKEEGFGKFSSALEAGEKLYPNTSNDGREEVRRELRALRDTWETFSDSLTDTQRQLDSSRMQWSTFDENFEQLSKWLTDTELQVDGEPELKASLQEKKALLQNYKTRYQDIVSHQSMIDSISDKGSALSSRQVQKKLQQLNAKYSTLCSSAEHCVKKAEDFVEEHQAYQDNYQACRDWLNNTREKVAVCAEPGGDKQALQNRLDRLQDTMAKMREGENKVTATHNQGERTLPHTSAPGQAALRREMDGLSSDWNTLQTRINDTHQGLVDSIKAMDLYDGSCESLNRWLRDTESQFKDCEHKSTLRDKQNQVQIFKRLQQEIASKQGQFDQLQSMAAQVQSSDSRLASYSTQLYTKYDGLKSLSKDIIGKWEDYVEEHQGFESSMGQCMEWVDTLRRRLAACADLAGDRQDVEDRLVKLQELSAERDEGSSKIHQTIESGERLYPNTAADGRDNIRQDIRNLRDHWDALRDEMSEVQRKLDVNLGQWSSYDENFETFNKWMLDIEVKLKEEAELKATLPDKKAQLQNHKVLHQDILSREHIIENLSEKAQALTQSTPSAKVNKFVGELQHKYSSICQLSKANLDKLDQSMREHQQYQDAHQDFTDWLNLARDKLQACADRTGDKLSLQGKKERIKEFTANMNEGERKLAVTKELGAKTARNTSVQGRDVLQREMSHLQREWEDYLSLLREAESSLEQTIGMWGDFESMFGQFADWLKAMEQKVKGHDLKNTLTEKEAQVEKFKREREEILSHQAEIDRFTDHAQNLMHTSSDVRLSTQISQLTNKYQGLLSLVKELIGKWEMYVQEHKLYDGRIQDFGQWIDQAKKKLDMCGQSVGDHESLEEKRAMIQMLFNEKEHGNQKLNAAIESGEKLYPDTAASGREKVRNELRMAKTEWENFLYGLSDAQRRVDVFLSQWSSYADGQEQLMRWMTETETALRADVDLRNTLQEKRTQLQHHRSLFQDIASHQRLVDSVLEKAQGVLQTTSNQQVTDFITAINSRYNKLNADAKGLIERSERSVSTHQDYQESLQAAIDWMSQMKDKQTLCADTSGDHQTIHGKLERLHELVTCMPEGADTLKECEGHAQATMDTTGLKGRQVIQQEMEVLKLDWEDYSSKVKTLKNSLEQTLHYWNLYESNYQQMSDWLQVMEKHIKESNLKSTLEEKQEQLAKHQELLQEVKGYQREMDKFTDEAQTLQQLTSESRVGNFVSQLSSRYQSLLTATKDLIKKSEQNVEDHKTFQNKLTDSSQWLTKAKEKFSQCSDVSGSRAELEDRLDNVQNLVRERDAGFSKLNQCVEAGERLYPTTAPDGRETIRQDLRTLKLGYEGLFDDLSAIQRKLEVSRVQWTSFDESYGQVEHWLHQMESQLEGKVPLRSTLEEKKIQLHNYKAMQQDVLSYQRVIDSISEKATNLAQTASTDPELSRFISQTASRYKKLCAAAKDRVSQYEEFVSEHQQYSDGYNDCVEWLKVIVEKLSACSDVSGDRQAIQTRLDKIQDILSTKMEGEPKVQNVLQLAELVLPHTAPQGKEVISRDTAALKDDWDAFIKALEKTKNDLESCMDQWRDFEAWQEKCAAWLKDLDTRLRDVDLKASLAEKESQLDRLKALQSEVMRRQSDLDSLTDAAQDLVRVSADSRVVSQASQLTTKHQTATINIKELCRRWEQYVLDHQAYNQAFDQCWTWLSQMKSKVSSVLDTGGDRLAVQSRLSKVQDLLSEKEEGLHMLQIATDNLQMVLPNTSVTGRDTMRSDMQKLQQEFDALSGELNEVKGQLDGTLAQWTVYDDSVEQLERWLKELEGQVELESQVQNTLQEKKLQLERLKVLQLNINSQQSTIDSLSEKVATLKRTSKDGNLGNQISTVVARYNNLGKSSKDLCERCEKNLRDHQLYRDTYMLASDWLGSTIDKLSLCSDVRGDRHAIEAQLHKVQEIGATVEAGRKKLQDAQAKGNSVIPETSTQGQELIKEELTMLTNDFEGFQTDLVDLKQTLSSLQQHWCEYEELYSQLNQWIKEMEHGMKVDSDLQASLQHKLAQYNKHKAVNADAVQQQETFSQLSEQAQVLMQSSTDGRVSTQLTQLSTRYSGLLTLSKDLLKRYEQTVQDHQTYKEAASRIQGWLRETQERVSVCADTSGDRFTIQAQLEKLQEFEVVKDEGQIYLHAAVTWGEKAMANTSVEGREVIRSELQQLQTDWDHIISQVTDTKVMLEACVLQWGDYSASHEQVIRWLKDMEKRLRDTQPKADLSEKKAVLQRIKGMYQDIVSYEHIVESVVNKASELAERSPASRSTVDTTIVQQRYNTVKEQAKELLARCEGNVAHHQDFHDSCNSFSSWLRTALEKLALCADTYGEKSAIEAKIERAKSLLVNLSEGTQRLSHATKAGEATLPSTSASGQTKIRQELQAINKDFEEFRLQLVEAQSDLETCLTRWDEFEDSYQEFGNWLRETEVLLRSELELKSTVEEKKQHFEEYQLYLEDCISHQSALDRVSEKAQALLQTNADAKTSHAISQLTTRYHAVIALAKDISSNLEAYHHNHRLYKQNYHLFNDWLKETKQRLKTVTDERGSRDNVHNKLIETDEIQGALDQGHAILRTVLSSCEKTLPNTNQRGVHVIRNEAESAKADYENILTQLSQVKRGLETAQHHWLDFESLHQQMCDWMDDVESRLGQGPELKSDLPEKRSSVEKYKALQADILAHKELLDRLEHKAGEVKDNMPRSRTVELRARYNTLVDSARAVVGRVEEHLAGHEDYRKSYVAFLEWVSSTKHRLQRLADYSGDKRTLQDRLHQLREFKSGLNEGYEMLKKSASLADSISRTTSARGQSAIQKEVDGLREDWNILSSGVEEVERNLETCIGNWTELDDQHTAFVHWMERMDAKVKACLDTKSTLARKRTALQEGEDLFDEILNYKSELTKVRDRGDAIAHRSNDIRVSNNLMQLSTQYQALCSHAKNAVSRLKECVSDHKQYDQSLEAAASWLRLTFKRVQACADSSGDWHVIQDRIEDIKDVTVSMDDGLQKVNYVCDLAEKILPHTSVEGKKLIEEQVTELTNEWEKLNTAIAECTAMLEGVQQRWHEYEQYYGSLVKWLADTESALRSNPEPLAQLNERKTQLDRYKMILADIESHRRLVNELSERVANLEALCDNPSVSESLDDVQTRYTNVVDKSRDVVEVLQRGYDEHLSFSDAQQDSEKWLLNMSYRLMSHNSLNVSSMELTHRQIDKHRLLLREIEDYRLTLDSVSRLGQQLILSNPRAPRLATSVQTQLTNLEESYLNLQSTAHQIRDRLNEVLTKWREYKELLDSTHSYLTNDFPVWLADAEKSPPNTVEDAQKQRETTQAELEKLHGMKQNVLTSHHRCESLTTGGTENTDKPEEEHVDSQVTKFADQVNSEMTACIAQAEKRLDRLRENMKKWDTVDRMRQDLHHWLHSKQEELHDLEKQPAKLHDEAAQMDLARLQRFREEVKARGAAIDQLQSEYRSLTQHNPSAVDPVIRAIKDDWEEVLGQLDILINDRQTAMAKARELQAHQDTMDEDLQNYIQELEQIDRSDNPLMDKSLQMQTQRRRCRGTQTRHSANTFSDSEDDSPGHSPWKTPRGPRGRGSFLFPSSPSRGPRGGRSPNTSRSNLRPPRRRHNDSHQDLRGFKKGAAANATLESESEESGYGETYGETMHASSFDTHLDEPSYWMGSEPAHTPLTFIESDDESAASFISGVFPVIDPENLRDTGCQTPGHVRTQTLELKDELKSSMTQTEAEPLSRAMQTSTSSLQSIGAQTKRSSGSRANLLKSILMEVKDIKKQQGLDDSRDETMSIRSDVTVSRDMLERVYRDVAALRAAGAQGDVMTQTASDMSTQTSSKLFPDGDQQNNSRQNKLSDMLEELRQLKNGNQSASTVHELDRATPTRSLNRTPLRFESPVTVPPVENGHGEHLEYFPGRRRVTQEDLDRINSRLDHLTNFQIQRRQLPTMPPVPSYPVAPPVETRPWRYRVREFSRSYDDLDVDYGARTRRHDRRETRDDTVMDRYHLDDALLEATIAARQLKRMSAKMKRAMRDELHKY